MKKTILLFSLLSTIMLTSCVTTVTAKVDFANSNTNFEFKIGQRVSGIDFDKYPQFSFRDDEHFECWGCTPYIRNDNGKTSYGTGGYTDLSSPLSITSVNTTDSKYSVFGIKVGDPLDKPLESLPLKSNYTYSVGYSAPSRPSVVHIFYVETTVKRNYETADVDRVSFSISFSGTETLIERIALAFYPSNSSGIVY